MTTRRRTTPRRQHGQAAVEFALVLPIIAVMALGLVAVGLVVRNELAVELAAREGAWAAAVSASPSTAATAAAQRSVELPIDVTTTGATNTVTVVVTCTGPLPVPIIGRLIGPITHTATVTMAVEPP